MSKFPKMKVLNSEGQEIVLNEREKLVATHMERQTNSLGFQIDINTMTSIQKKITEQKFFEIPPADYMPLRVGNGSWSAQLTTYRQFSLGDDFSTGIINAGSNNARLAQTDVGIDAVNVPVINWGKAIGWTLFELQQASLSGNWDLITAKEQSRKKNWDLGIQKIAFLGMGSIPGLLTQQGITTDSTTIGTPISQMSGAQLKIFVAAILNVYRANNNRTAWPTHFVVPESDYLGLASPSSADFPLKSVIQVLQETFAVMTKNPSFQILPCAYGDAAYNGLGAVRYALYNGLDDASLRMDIPVDYTNTLANSADSFSWQNVGFGQFTGCYSYRPQELMYFTHA